MSQGSIRRRLFSREFGLGRIDLIIGSKRGYR